MQEILNTVDIISPIIKYGALSGGIVGLWTYYKNCVKPKNKLCKATELSMYEGSGIKLTKNVQLSVKQSNQHILGIATSGWGKSRAILMPNINQLNNQECSIVVTDPCSEIYRETNTNKKEYIIDPFYEDTCGYDPLYSCENESDVEKMCKTILINGVDEKSTDNMSEWFDMSLLLLTSFMTVTWRQKKNNFISAVKFICTKDIFPKRKKDEEIDYNNLSVSDVILSSGIKYAIDKFLAFTKIAGAQQTFSCIRGIMNTALKCFMDSSMRFICVNQRFDFSVLREESSIVYIQIPEEWSDFFKPFTATFFSQLFDYLKRHGGIQVYCMFDEFANCGKISEMDKLLTTLRKHDVSILALVQSISQIEKLYGKDITDLFKTIFCGCSLKDSSKYISELLGNDKNGNKLMTAEEVRRMDENDVLIISGNKRPVIDHKMDLVC